MKRNRNSAHAIRLSGVASAFFLIIISLSLYACGSGRRGASGGGGVEAGGEPAGTGQTGPAKPAMGGSGFWALTGVPEDEAVELLLAGLSQEERLGQLFMLAYQGTMPGEVLLAWLRTRGLGGIKIFGWNAEDTDVVAAAVRAMHAQGSPLGIPPFIATDQEGGWIRHVKGNTSITPGNMAIGASAWPSDAYKSAYYIGRELAALGITMNFAPTVDLATRPDSRIIGSRAFSDDPMETAVLAAAYSRGLSDAGVVATAKHYPGHGDTQLDSHGVLPVIHISKKTLLERELVPYRLLAAEGIPAIMSGHLSFPDITGNNDPASLSPLMIRDILRKELGFRGLVITDDLVMGGADSPEGLSFTCERAIRAGNDVLMLSRELALDDRAWTRLASLCKSDSGFRDRVNESARRVLLAKIRYLLPLGKKNIIPGNKTDPLLRTAESRGFFLSQAGRSATKLGKFSLPALKDSPRLLVAGQFSDFFTEAKTRLPSALVFRYSYLPAEKALENELQDFKARLGVADSVLVVVANPASAEFAMLALEAGKKVYIISVLSPFFALGLAARSNAVAVYSYSGESFIAGIAVLSGDFEAIGELPFGELPFGELPFGGQRSGREGGS